METVVDIEKKFRPGPARTLSLPSELSQRRGPRLPRVPAKKYAWHAHGTTTKRPSRAPDFVGSSKRNNNQKKARPHRRTRQKVKEIKCTETGKNMHSSGIEPDSRAHQMEGAYANHYTMSAFFISYEISSSGVYNTLPAGPRVTALHSRTMQNRHLFHPPYQINQFSIESEGGPM